MSPSILERFILVAATLLLLVILLLSISSSSSNLLQIVEAAGAEDFTPMIVFIHRHGARTPQGVVDQKTICEFPLCQLTKAGLSQCASAGQHLQKEFLGPLAGITNYSVKTLRTESTDTKRTVMSAESVIAGAFGKRKSKGDDDDDEDVAPFVNFVPTSMDFNMSFWSSWPYWKVSQARETRLATTLDYIKKNFENVDGKNLITEFGKLFKAEQLCKRSPVDCLILVADVLECNASNADPLPELLTKNSVKIKATKALMFAKLLGYDPSEKHCTEPGSWAYDLAVELLEGLEYAPSKKADDWPIRAFHYSAHDWTIFPLYSAFGFWKPWMATDPQWLPLFADTFVLHTVKNTKSKKGLGVKAFRFYPQQKPSGPVEDPASFPIDPSSKQEIGLLCTHTGTTGTTTTTTTTTTSWSNETIEGCTIEDLWTTVQRVAPQAEPVGGGKCYATHDDMHKSQCLSDDAPQEGSSCAAFRSVCNQQPCGQAPVSVKSALSQEEFRKISDPQRDLACTDIRPQKDGDYPTGTAVTLVSTGFVVGSLLGAVLMKLLYGKIADYFDDVK